MLSFERLGKLIMFQGFHEELTKNKIIFFELSMDELKIPT